jgi:transketolase C-terminal domain/subunit
VNDLPGGAGHHDGHMKGRNVDQVLANPMMQLNPEQEAQLKALRAEPKKKIITKARPATGSKNLVLNRDDAAEPLLPSPGKWTSARAGVEAGYLAVAKAFPENVFVVSCDLDPSTKLAKARAKIDALHQFEMSIEEQASALMANGLAMTGERPQLNVFSTFAAFFEGIAREGLELWRYQRNLNGSNEGLNVTFHMSHVGACTGRDHFSGWSLDWINLAKGYLPYLHRFYAPADARSAFIAVRDLAAHYGGHIIAIPRDNLPVLTGPDGKSPLWDNNSPWEAVTEMRTNKGAEMAILAFGAPAYLAIEASEALTAKGTAVDALVVNGLPFRSGQLEKLLTHYPKGIVTIEDGLIGTVDSGLLGFAAIVAGASAGRVPTQHVGIRDPRIAPADGHTEVWEHFGLTTNALIEAIKSLL